jgi:CheY-like chemotaxis protein
MIKKSLEGGRLMGAEPIKILLVDDNPDHVILIKTVLEENNLLNEIYVVTDGQEALDYMYCKGKYADESKAPRPGLILLDLKLPKVDGFEVLSQLKSDPELKSIPIIILTTSSQDEEIAKGYAQGANSFVTKPIKFNEFVDKIKNIQLYWVLVNTLPKR